MAGTSLPLIIFAAGIVFHDYIKDRREATQRVLETVRGVRFTLDAEMRRMTGGLQVLSLTSALRSGDFAGFGAMAAGFLDQYGKDGVILVADREGRILFPAIEPDGPTPPQRNNLAIVDKVFTTGQPQYSNLFYGVVKKKWIMTVDVPVMRDGQVVYDISFSPPLEMFQSMVEKQRPSADWTVTLLDAEGVVFARVPNPDTTVGKHASPSLLPELFKSPEATLNSTSLEGIPLITGFSRSPLTGWTIPRI